MEISDDIRNEFKGLTINKSLNDSLAGIVGNNFVELTTTKVSYDSHHCISRATDILANGVSSLPIQVYRGDTLLDTGFILPNQFNINRPHPKVDLSEMLYQSAVHLFFDGEMMLYIDLEPPFSLEVLQPKKAVRLKNGNWKYDNKFIIPNEQLIYVKIYSPGKERGLSPIDVVKKDILSDISAAQYNESFWKNYTSIGGTLTDTKGVATNQQIKDATAAFNQKYSGAGRSHQTIGLAGGLRYEQQTQTLREMEFLESRKEVSLKILQALGVHKCLVGMVEGVNRSVSEEASRQLWLQIIKPKAMQIQSKINQHLFNRYFPGYTAKFDFSDIDALKQSIETKLEQAKEMRALGYTINEINEKLMLGMEDITDPIGDMRLLPTNLIPADDFLMDDVSDSNSKVSDNSKSVGHGCRTLDKAVDLLVEEGCRTNEEKCRTEKSRATRNYVRQYNKVTRKSEKQIAGKVGKYFSQQLGKVMKIVRKHNKGIDDLNTILAEIQNLINDEKDLLAETMTPVYVAGSTAATKLALGLSPVFVTRADYAQEVVESMTNKIKGINGTTYKNIRIQLKQSIEAGESTNQLAKRIQGIYKFNSGRTRLIARTESNFLVSRTTDKVFKENDVKKKSWGGNMDEDTRETHAANQNAGVVDYNHTYSNGQSFPGDGVGGASENCNCRCVLIPEISRRA